MFPKFNIGKSGEEYVKYLLEHVGFKCELNNNYELRYDYDLTVNMNGRKFTAEIKYDLYSIKSGNLAIEYYNSKKDMPSGIYATLADIWIHLIPEKSGNISAYAISVPNLIKFFETAEPFKVCLNAGDVNSNMKIYKMTDILPHFARFDLIKDEKIMFNLFNGLLDG